MSFSASAEELLVTQAAVSKRIRQLEDHLGMALFLRNGRMIEITDEGRKLAEQCSILLDFAETALDSVGTRPDAPVRIAANSAVSLFWLSPRLKRFGLSDMACPVELVSSDHPDTLQDQANDISILHGDGVWKDRLSIPLFPDVLVPVLSVQRAAQAGLQSGYPLSLAPEATRPPLLSFPRVTPDWTNWDNWGNTGELDGWPRVECGTYARSIGAALDGDGIALANPHILSSELETGQLVQLAPMAQSTNKAYFLTYANARFLGDQVTRLLSYLSRKLDIQQR